MGIQLFNETPPSRVKTQVCKGPTKLRDRMTETGTVGKVSLEATGHEIERTRAREVRQLCGHDRDGYAIILHEMGSAIGIEEVGYDEEWLAPPLVAYAQYPEPGLLLMVVQGPVIIEQPRHVECVGDIVTALPGLVVGQCLQALDGGVEGMVMVKVVGGNPFLLLGRGQDFDLVAVAFEVEAELEDLLYTRVDMMS